MSYLASLPLRGGNRDGTNCGHRAQEKEGWDSNLVDRISWGRSVAAFAGLERESCPKTYIDVGTRLHVMDAFWAHSDSPPALAVLVA